MPKITPESIAAELEPVAVAAVLAAKNAKLMGEVNCQDNFALYFSPTAYDAALDYIIAVIDEPEGERRDAFIDWLNNYSSVSAKNHVCLKDLARTWAAKAYVALNAKS